MVKNRLRVILAQKDIVKAELSRMTGIHPGVIGRICHDEFANLSNDVMNKICNALNITPSELFEYIPDLHIKP